MTYIKIELFGAKTVTREIPHQIKSDHELIKLGIRPRKLHINYSTFRKTKEEKTALKFYKKRWKEKGE